MKKVPTTVYIEEFNRKWARAFIPNLSKFVNDKIEEYSNAEEGKALVRDTVKSNLYTYQCEKHGIYKTFKQTGLCPVCGRKLIEVKE